MLSLTQSVGAHSAGGTDALFERRTLAGLGAEEDSGLSARSLDARIGYGFGVFEGRYTATPELGLSDSGRELRLGWRLAGRVPAGIGFELGFEGTRRDSVDDDRVPEHAVGLNLTTRW